MIRITFVEVALVATPFLLFFLYRAMVSARRTATGEAIDETPYQVLFFVGSAAALAGLAAVVLFNLDRGPGESRSRDEVYIPARIVDGKVQPGHFVDRDEAVARGLIEDRPRDRDYDPDTEDGGEPAPAQGPSP